MRPNTGAAIGLLASAISALGIPLLAGTAVGSTGPAASNLNGATQALPLALGDRAVPAGLLESNKTWAATPVDYDQDGDQDVWIGFHQKSGKLWSNDGDGTYTRVAASAWPAKNADGTITDRHDCAWADVDQNGLPDAYCSAGRNQSNYVKDASRDNELWLQGPVGRFSEVGTQWGVGDQCGRGRHVTFIDANADTYPDLFLGNEYGRSTSDRCDDPANRYTSEDSKLFLNLRGIGFAPGLNEFGSVGAGQRCAELLDYNGDGRDDLFTCLLKGQVPKLWRNDGAGRFTDVSVANHLSSAAADMVPVDYDGDGDTDVLSSSTREVDLRLNVRGTLQAKKVLRSVPKASGDIRSIAAGDVDGDGQQDIYVAIQNSAYAAGNPDDFIMIRSGSTYTNDRVPSATGLADEVVALHPTGPGAPAQFVVLNGGNGGEAVIGGPVQLITFAPGS